MTKSLVPSSAPALSLRNLSPYENSFLAKVRQIPLLSAEQEHELALKFRDQKDRQAGETLILSHLHLVVSMAYKFRHYHVPLEDLIADGTVGLIKAVQTFDPDRGVRLSTHAMYWIKASLYDNVLHNSSIVRQGISHDERKLFFKLAGAKEELGLNMKTSLSEDDFKALSEKLSIPIKTIKEAESFGVTSFEPRTPDSGSMLELIESKAPTPHEVVSDYDFKKRVFDITQEFLDQLPARERDIFSSRYLKMPPQTLDALAQIHGVSKERIRQIEEKLVEQLRARVTKEIPTYDH